MKVPDKHGKTVETPSTLSDSQTEQEENSKTSELDQQSRGTYFAFFNEIGIISQLSRTMMEARMPDGLSMAHFSGPATALAGRTKSTPS